MTTPPCPRCGAPQCTQFQHFMGSSHGCAPRTLVPQPDPVGVAPRDRDALVHAIALALYRFDRGVTADLPYDHSYISRANVTLGTIHAHAAPAPQRTDAGEVAPRPPEMSRADRILALTRGRMPDIKFTFDGCGGSCLAVTQDGTLLRLDRMAVRAIRELLATHDDAGYPTKPVTATSPAVDDGMLGVGLENLIVGALNDLEAVERCGNREAAQYIRAAILATNEIVRPR